MLDVCGLVNRMVVRDLYRKMRSTDVEQAVFEAMKERIKTLEIAKKKCAKPSAEVEKKTQSLLLVMKRSATLCQSCQKQMTYFRLHTEPHC